MLRSSDCRRHKKIEASRILGVGGQERFDTANAARGRFGDPDFGRRLVVWKDVAKAPRSRIYVDRQPVFSDIWAQVSNRFQCRSTKGRLKALADPSLPVLVWLFPQQAGMTAKSVPNVSPP